MLAVMNTCSSNVIRNLGWWLFGLMSGHKLYKLYASRGQPVSNCQPMSSNKFKSIFILVAVGGAGWLACSYFQRDKDRKRQKIIHNKFKSIFILVAVGGAGWLACSYFLRDKDRKRQKIIQFRDNGKTGLENFIDMPGLPVFASVSIATLKAKINSQTKLVPDPRRNSRKTKYEFPSLDQLCPYGDFVVCYNRRTKVANWVFENIPTGIKRWFIQKYVNRLKWEFIEDKSVHKCFRASPSDYRQSGFDRGHLAAAGNHIANRPTYFLTNVAPQVGKSFNSSIWNELENRVRKVSLRYISVYVCTGPLYLAKEESDGKKYVKYQVIGSSEIAVPTHFFKVIIMETGGREFHLESYRMPNEAEEYSYSHRLENYYVPPETIEMSAGILFFNEMTRSRLVMINGVQATFV